MATQPSNSALQRGFAIIETVAAELRPLSANEIAQILDMPRQTAHRMIQQLTEMGLLEREAGAERYITGPRLRRLGLACISSFIQTQATHAILAELSVETGETCNIGVLDGHEVVYIDRVEANWPLRVELRPGSRVPLHCTAIGKLLLAHAESRARRKILAAVGLPRLTERTITDPVQLDLALEEIQNQGYAINDQEDAIGLRAIAAPVRDPHGGVIAGVAVHAPTARVSLDKARSFLPALRRAAERIGEALTE